MLYEGEEAWKSRGEYNPNNLLRGIPYFIITKKGFKKGECTYGLYEYDVENEQYVLLKEVGDERGEFSKLHELGMEKADQKTRELYKDHYAFLDSLRASD
jgi:hypothetical protein